MNFLYYWTY